MIRWIRRVRLVVLESIGCGAFHVRTAATAADSLVTDKPAAHAVKVVRCTYAVDIQVVSIQFWPRGDTHKCHQLDDRPPGQSTPSNAPQRHN